MPETILFICHANQFRSPLAAVLLNQLLLARGLESTWRAESAGVWAQQPGQPAAPGLDPLARSLGLSELEAHRSRSVSAELLQAAALILVMEGGQKEALQLEFPATRERLFLLSEMSHRLAYDIPDPARKPADSQKIGQEIVRLVERGFEQILRQANAGRPTATDSSSTSA